MERKQMTDTKAVLAFVLGGRATFTLVSKRTGDRFTFKVAEPTKKRAGEAIRFVELLGGPDNEGSYQYLGFARQQRTSGTWAYDHGVRSKVPNNSKAALGFKWFFKSLLGSSTTSAIPQDVEFWHEGICCRCGRKLTVPSSIDTGIGPECAKKAPLLHSTAQMGAPA